MGWGGHCRDAGDGTRGRRTDPQSPGLSNVLHLPAKYVVVVRATRTVAGVRNFTFRRAAWYDVKDPQRRRPPLGTSLSMARADREAAWSVRVVLTPGKEFDG